MISGRTASLRTRQLCVWVPVYPTMATVRMTVCASLIPQTEDGMNLNVWNTKVSPFV